MPALLIALAPVLIKIVSMAIDAFGASEEMKASFYSWVAKVQSDHGISANLKGSAQSQIDAIQAQLDVEKGKQNG